MPSLTDSDTMNIFLNEVVELWTRGREKKDQTNRSSNSDLFNDELKPVTFLQASGPKVTNHCHILMPKLATLGGFESCGHFDYPSWTIKLQYLGNGRIFEFRSFVEVISLGYHELRHVEQFYRMAEYMVKYMSTNETWKKSEWRSLAKAFKPKGRCPKCGEEVFLKSLFCGACGTKQPEAEEGEYRPFKTHLKTVVPKKNEENKNLKVSVAKALGAPAQLEQWAEWSVKHFGAPPQSAEIVFGWYNSVFGMGSSGRKLCVDKVLGGNPSENELLQYKLLPEEKDAYYVQAQLKQLICENIPGKDKYDAENNNKWMI